MAATNPFVEEIDFREIKLQGVVGKGSFGTVRKGKWRNLVVAIKMIETEQEKKAFIVEVQQLSRVNHPNIVKLYGACTKTPVCLVMEYAEGGSLYNVLHCMKQVVYTAAHAISWLLQTANGVAYLHNMKPPLIHRDLKPPNLLLINGGTVLKICDFGTACDIHTNMTNSKGSAAWMAPEVFEGSTYSEKCDVFSWAIILWEVLTRKKPFHDGEGATAFGIMWAVHNGKRPPLIKGCPKPIESLMTRCWDKDAVTRPSMTQVQNELAKIFQFMEGADKPITFLPPQEISVSEESTPTTSSAPKPETGSSGYKTVLPQKLEDIPGSPLSSFVDSKFLCVENAGEKYAKDMKKRRSADFSNSDMKLPTNLGHRRSGSCDSPHLKAPEVLSSFPKDLEYFQIPVLSEESVKNNFSEEMMNNISYSGNYFFLLEPKLQPLPPAQCPESVEIYEKHLDLARELFRQLNEITLLTEKKNDYEAQLKEGDNSNSYIDEFIQLKKENDSLLQLRQNLKTQLEIIRSKQRQRSNSSDKANGEDWVLV
ncbi:mitogen-activated protein kinase kinase kinase 7 [Parasteatoda tepidariorum]|nr:mitogen-activated protein kinase kinase kinase 7 [Parasteatoda tepidariorum]XP_015922326.1 mitogen-activated protein kinase kinase kinase 7 [Parasteatoda tepidariorum]XP_015922327.1 mitogen-activated protein kinase kinase kinase 7 [Parasteatoda tepidariorum]XP_015922328.1 mitogen-activated protein kinase kinase kinase 7 [Parasteatoda tepidariorum]XP_042895146.1 mitogen-activated protein kinase kinase kinase 7 [Parasteatoda tepidariorum]